MQGNNKEIGMLKSLIKKSKSTKLTSEEQAKLEELKAKYPKNPKHNESGKTNGFKPGNDFSWWNKEPELLRDTANLKSNWIAGMELAADGEFPFRPAGAVRIIYDQLYGISDNPTDPLNLWARDLWLKMFQKYRNITNYSYSDLGITILASLEVVGVIAKLERTYGVVTRYSKANLNMPYTEAAALGLNVAEADYIRGHLSDFRADLNYLIKKAQRLCIPKDISEIADTLSLLGYEYLDHDNTKAQIIVFDKLRYGVYYDTKLSTGGSIFFEAPSSATPLIDFTGTSNNMFPFLNMMLDSLLGSQSILKIYGDLFTWFGEEQMLQFLPLPEDYLIVPVYEESILHKMHNIEGQVHDANIMYLTATHKDMASADVAAIQSSGTFAIYQFNDVIICKPVFAKGTLTYVLDGNFRYPCGATSINGYFHTKGASIIDTYRVDPTDEVITEGVLFKKGCEYFADGSNHDCVKVTSAAFQIIRQAIVYTLDPTNSTTMVSTTNSGLMGQSAFAVGDAGTFAILDWAPLVYVLDQLSPNIGRFTAAYGDIDTPIPIAKFDMSKLHRTIVLSGIKTDIQVINKN